MTQVRNPARERLVKNELALGIGLRQSRSVDIAKMMRASGFDWLFLDLEHSTMSLDTAGQISVAALDAGIAPIVRVPMMQLTMATRALDGGALGIVMPHVDTAEEARAVADALRYPPVGHRSIAGGLPQLDFRTPPVSEVVRVLNEATLVVVMLETPKAIENVDAIAAVPGIDVLLIGTSDLSLEMGVPGQPGHEKIQDAYTKVIAAARKHGKWPGMGGIYSGPEATRYIQMGARFVLAGNDLSLLMAAATERANTWRKIG
jgi:2-keto-3-deoxy-L-rhamnonate aldolase RhmA